MNTTRLSQARRLFFVAGVPTSTARHNARAWARSVRFLGPRWRIAKPAPIPVAAQPTLGQLRERLKEARAKGWGLMPYSETETVADHMEKRVEAMEIAAGLRTDYSTNAVRGLA